MSAISLDCSSGGAIKIRSARTSDTFADYVLNNAFDLDTNPGLYDHDFAQSARFWISVRAAA